MTPRRPPTRPDRWRALAVAGARRRPSAAAPRPAQPRPAGGHPRAARSCPRSPVDEQQRDVLEEPHDADRLGRARIGAQLARATPVERRRAATNRRPGRAAGRATGSRSSGADEFGDDRHDPRPRRRVDAARRASGSRVRGRERPSPRTATDGERDDAAHRRPTSATRRDPALAEPGERAGDVLDLEQPERRRAVVRPAVPPEVEPEHARGPAQERAVRDEVRRDRARPAVEQQDRLAWVGRPAVIAGLGGQPAAGQPDAVPRAQPDDLAAERVDRGPERRPRPGPVRGAIHEAPRHAVADGSRPPAGRRRGAAAASRSRRASPGGRAAGCAAPSRRPVVHDSRAARLRAASPRRRHAPRST